MIMDDSFSHKLGTVKTSPFSSINFAPPSIAEPKLASSQKKQPNLDVMTSLSVVDGSLSLTVVMQPPRKQSLRLSFPGTLPMENAHRRLYTEDSVETQNRFSFYSDDSGGGSSDFDQSADGSTVTSANDFTACNNQFYEASESMSVSEIMEGPMEGRLSKESDVDPHINNGKVATRAASYPPRISKIQSHQELVRPKHSQSARWVSDVEYHKSRRIVRKNSFATDALGTNSDPNAHPLFVTSALPSAWTTNNILNLFPLPPNFDQSSSAITAQSGALACVRRAQSCNPAMRSREALAAYDLSPVSSRLPSFDFDTYHGLINDIRISQLCTELKPPDNFINPALSSVGGASITLCDTVTVEEDSIKEHIVSMEDSNLEQAQLCMIKDENGRERYFKDVIRHRRTIVFFLRYFWCCKGQEYVKSICETFAPGTPARGRLDESNSTIIFIGSGSWKMISTYRAVLDCSFEMFTDTSPTRKLFVEMGLHRMLLGGSLWQTVVGSAKRISKLSLHKPGSFAQLGGEFCLERLENYGLHSTATLKKLAKDKRRITKFTFNLPQFSRRSRQLAPTLEEIADPFRRSFAAGRAHAPDTENCLPAVRCTYANRMKSSESEVDYAQLFQSIGLDISNDSTAGSVV